MGKPKAVEITTKQDAEKLGLTLIVLPWGVPKDFYHGEFCSCGHEDTEQFVGDNACHCGVRVHHTHCETCGGLVQIG